MLNVYISTNRFPDVGYIAIVDATPQVNLGAAVPLTQLGNLTRLNIGGVPWPAFIARHSFCYRLLYQANSIEEAKSTLLDLYPEYFV